MATSSTTELEESVVTVESSDIENSDSSDTDNPVNPPVEAFSLLSRLRCPAKSDLSRKRKIQSNPPKGRKTSSAHHKQDPKVKATVRIKEFPNEELTVSGGHLFCSACRETLSVKRSTIANHIKSSKHRTSKENLKKKQIREDDIAKALQNYDKSVHPKRETLSQEQRVYRVKVVTTFLKAGIPISKIVHFRGLLEENALRLTDTSHLRELIPFISTEERSRVKKEIDGKFISLIFDGTSRLGEVLAIVLRFVDDWKVVQCLVRLEFLEKSMTGEEVAREIISILAVSLGIQSHLLIAAMRDGASVNSVAMRTIGVMFPHTLDVRCFSHTLDLVGDRFETPTLGTFISHWVSLFAHSPKTRALWKEQTGTSMKLFSKTRWWSKGEVIHLVMKQFGDVIHFLQQNQDIRPSLRQKLLDNLVNPSALSLLKIEMAIVVDVGEHFVKSTYKLEGDGLLALICYEEILKLRSVIQVAHYPNTFAIARELAGGSPQIEQQWISYALGCVHKAFLYFENKFGDDSQLPLSAFKAFRYFSPSKIKSMNPSAADIVSLSVIPFLNNPDTIAGLTTELPTYLAKADAVDPQRDVLEWWKDNTEDLPNWSSAAKKVVLTQPSSGAAERVFSLLNASFGDNQEKALEDYVEASIMLQYNER